MRKGIYVVFFGILYKAETKALETSRTKLHNDLATRTRLEARKTQEKEDASSTSSSEEEEKDETEEEKEKNKRKSEKAAQMKANREKVQARKVRSEAREKRKLDAAAAPKVAGPRGRRWPPKKAAVETAAEEEMPEVPGVPEAEAAV